MSCQPGRLKNTAAFGIPEEELQAVFRLEVGELLFGINQCTCCWDLRYTVPAQIVL